MEGSGVARICKMAALVYPSRTMTNDLFAYHIDLADWIGSLGPLFVEVYLVWFLCTGPLNAQPGSRVSLMLACR